MMINFERLDNLKLMLSHCEKYLRDENSAKKLLKSVKEEYASLISFFDSEAVNPWIASVITPVQTVGNVVFSRIKYDDLATKQNPHFYFRKTRHDAKYDPKDSEQPLRYLLRFLLKLHLDSRHWGRFNFLRNWFKADTHLTIAIEQFAKGCKTSNGFEIIKGEQWLK